MSNPNNQNEINRTFEVVDRRLSEEDYEAAAAASSRSVNLVGRLQTRSIWCQILLVVAMAVTAVSTISSVAEIDLLNDFKAVDWENTFYSQSFLDRIFDRIESNSDRQGWIGIVLLTVNIGAVITILRWMYAASVNLRHLGINDQQYSPGWSVGWWFVPVGTLFMPYRVLRELWRGSDPDAGESWRLASVWPWLGWYWAAWLIGMPRMIVGLVKYRSHISAKADIIEFPGLTTSELIAA